MHVKTSRIFEARSDEPWVMEGAAVRVSIVCFCLGSRARYDLDGTSVTLYAKILPIGATDSLA